MHEKERPAVGDACLRPEQRTLQVHGVGAFPVLSFPGVSRLSVTVKLYSLLEVSHPVGHLDSFLLALLLCRDSQRHKSDGCQKDCFLFHYLLLFVEKIIGAKVHNKFQSNKKVMN